MLARNRMIVGRRRRELVSTERWDERRRRDSQSGSDEGKEERALGWAFSCRTEDRKEREGRRAAPEHKKSDLIDE